MKQRELLEQLIPQILLDSAESLNADTLPSVFPTLFRKNSFSSLLRGYSFDCPPVSEPESHPFYEFAFQLTGTSVILLGDRYFLLQPGQFLICDRNQMHCLAFEKDPLDPPAMCWLNISAHYIRSGYSVYTGSDTGKRLGNEIDMPADFLLDRVFREMKSQEPDAAMIASQLLKSLLLLLYRDLSFSENTENSWCTRIAMELMEYVNSHLFSTLRLQELSNVVSLSPGYLSKAFKQATGQTITSYIQEQKMNQACALLIQKKLSVEQVASQLGYYDQYHFSNAFKSFTGMSPTAYRKEQLRQEPGSN